MFAPILVGWRISAATDWDQVTGLCSRKAEGQQVKWVTEPELSLPCHKLWMVLALLALTPTCFYTSNIKPFCSSVKFTCVFGNISFVALKLQSVFHLPALHAVKQLASTMLICQHVVVLLPCTCQLPHWHVPVSKSHIVTAIYWKATAMSR